MIEKEKPGIEIPGVCLIFKLKMMEEKNVKPSEEPSAWFLFCKQVLEDNRAIKEHLRNGGELEDLKDQYDFVMPFTAADLNTAIARYRESGW
ncbi:hypothetical protein [Chitinophaga barathri]|uniref:Uncharacterized protein n=1 Tax=Chitinophaga barathri TaxID=1647451 RepID=A0A3N4MBG4_9BACT|nr:hypothetical protein [Chitinophaga barathri]RPD40828.1 hypothetical protein EG028_12420 [Chitinophaga barathri]